MPVYEYEPDDRPCFMCNGLITVLQDVNEAALPFCPDCGQGIRRIVSRAAFKVDSGNRDLNKAADRGFTTFKRTSDGNWEKIAGQGAEGLARPVDEPGAAKKVIDLDKP